MSTSMQDSRHANQLVLGTLAPVNVSVTARPPSSASTIGICVTASSAPPASLGLDRQELARGGFTAAAGSTLVIPRSDGPTFVAVGLGDVDELDTARIRDAAAAFALAASTQAEVAFSLEGLEAVPTETAAQAAVEGMLLARYEYAGKRERKSKRLDSIAIVTDEAEQAAAHAGAERGRAYAKATILARDLGNMPHSHLNALQLADRALVLGSVHGFEVEIFDKEALQRLRCGGLLSVNAGSSAPPCMIKLVYRPKNKSTGSLAMIGKGVMYDSGGISLKPSDPVHARMKNDMSGAAAVLAAVAEMHELGCSTTVTGYLMCTDNMPSGSAMALGDVFTTHGGKTVEVCDTDAEGRLVMCDALELAVEEQHDAIVDIATLTGSCARALGADIAGLFGNDSALLAQLEAAALATGELVWQLPLHPPYREILDSEVADLRNCGPVGQPDAIAAALFLSEFVGETPWAHADIAGTAWNEKDRLWRRAGCSGFGARLLLELAMHFRPAARRARH